MNIEPIVAAYALFSTNFVSLEVAMDFIYEKEEDLVDGRFKYIHKFFGCLPAKQEYMTKYV